MRQPTFNQVKVGLAVFAVALFFSAEAAHAVKVTIGGHVNRMIRFADNGDQSDIQHLDNSASQTRLRVSGKDMLQDGMMAGFNWETGMASNLSEFQDIEQTGNDSNSEFLIRVAEVWVSSDEWGKVALGQGDGAARHSGRKDLSGTELAHNNDFRRLHSVRFRDSGGFFVGDVSEVFHSYEGVRDDRLRYDSPSIRGITGAASIGNNDEFEAGLVYDGKLSYLDGAKLIGAIGYTRNLEQGFGSPDIDYQLSTSWSLALKNDFNVTAAYGRQNLDKNNNDSNQAYYLKLGYKLGQNAFSIDWGCSIDSQDPLSASNTVDGTHYGVGWARPISRYNSTLYAGLRNFQMDREVTGVPNPDDVLGFHTGVQVNF
jgi:predicted porin